MTRRPSIDRVMLDLAFVWAQRATCPRLHVGAVLARDGRAIASGYNGAPAGMAHCPQRFVDDREKVADHLDLPHCTTAIHAERNVIGYAAREGIATGGATLYLTHSPCAQCATILVPAGIERVVYASNYGDGSGIDYLQWVGVKVEMS